MSDLIDTGLYYGYSSFNQKCTLIIIGITSSRPPDVIWNFLSLHYTSKISKQELLTKHFLYSFTWTSNWKQTSSLHIWFFKLSFQNFPLNSSLQHFISFHMHTHMNLFFLVFTHVIFIPSNWHFHTNTFWWHSKIFPFLKQQTWMISTLHNFIGPIFPHSWKYFLEISKNSTQKLQDHSQ